MDLVFEVCRALSIVAFLSYGLVCLFSESMVAEFERFGLPRMRTLTGALEVLGALGLLVGYFCPPLVTLASAGLSVLMLMGILVRVRIHDGAVVMLPALVLLLVNAFVFAYSI